MGPASFYAAVSMVECMIIMMHLAKVVVSSLAVILQKRCNVVIRLIKTRRIQAADLLKYRRADC